jgi:FixJ family two-component response regulator
VRERRWPEPLPRFSTGAFLPDHPLIAIVDDDESVRVSVASLLRSLGYGVQAFASAEAFLEGAAAARSACLITDVQMPGINGMDLLRRVMAGAAALPVIMITAYPDEALRQRALSAGARGFLSKPFDEDTLIRCLDAALRYLA